MRLDSRLKLDLVCLRHLALLTNSTTMETVLLLVQLELTRLDLHASDHVQGAITSVEPASQVVPLDLGLTRLA